MQRWLPLTFLILITTFATVVAQPVVIAIPDTDAVIENEINIPINVLTDVTGMEIYSYQISVCFDPTVLEFMRSDSQGTMSENWTSLFNSTDPANIRIGAFTTTPPLSGSGILRYLTFNIIGAVDDQTTLEFCPPDSFFFNSGVPTVNMTGANVTLVSGDVITIDTDPSGLDVEVDQLPFAAPQTFHWVPNSTHSISAPSPQVNGTTRYLWNNWNDGGSQTHQATSAGDFTYIATYDTQYMLTTAVDPSAGGSIALDPLGPWYDPNTTVQLTANENANYTFSNWTGDLTGSTNPGNLTMDAPKQVTAHFSPLAILGDVNGDMAANSTDALIILSCDVGINVSSFCPMDCGDVDDSGNINSTDALIILSNDVGMSVPFPVGSAGCPTGVTPCAGCNP